VSVLKFVQYYLDCLSQASYLIGDETSGQAVVVDPRRDVEVYLDDAAAAGLAIRLVIETHFHADFLSGHLELAEATGAEIAYGRLATTDFRARHLADGQRISLGDVALEVLETPGHTPESISLVVWEHATDMAPYGVLTGDTLFIGDVGRPDLLASAGHSPEEMGRRLYHSLHEKLLRLPDSTRIFPAHGAGSACGRNLSTERSSTIGEQRLSNYALKEMSEASFVALVTEAQPAAPAYFGYDALLNRQVRPLLHEHDELPAMTLDEVLAAQQTGAVLLDTRPSTEYVAGHLRRSLHAGLDTRFAEYAGSVVPPGTPVVVAGAPGSEVEAKVRLARIGFDSVVGYLPDLVGKVTERPQMSTRTSVLTAAQFLERQSAVPELEVLDVRNPAEVARGAVQGARLVPLPALRSRLSELSPARPVAVYCASGVRSVIAASLLEQQGFADVSSVLGGFDAIAHQGSLSAPR
jgi:hydroxyacylglutathione hydrolase